MESLANPIEYETSEDGEIPAGAILISIKNIGEIDGIVNGVTLEAGEPTNYEFAAKPYVAIAYKTNGSTFKIRYTV